ncbi:hypothetical protein [Paenibacillus sp. OAS669]|uniref:hypothetical protein n=1 Tax=Paenibacillus sp. OAS669 TaxID=2663821 RepID=UPI00178BAE5F|nr:hypothetical protein [Paenibacillus sp. OAS669]MBE1444795.1 hypothetical protein [Paenibacillus sp. OAS669]
MLRKLVGTCLVFVIGLISFSIWNYVDDDVRRVYFERQRAWQDQDFQKVKQIYIKTEKEEVLLTEDSRIINELMQDLKYKLATNQYWLVRAKNGDFIPYNKGGWELVIKTDEFDNLAFVKYSQPGDVLTYYTFYGPVAAFNSSNILKNLLKEKNLL